LLDVERHTATPCHGTNLSARREIVHVEKNVRSVIVANDKPEASFVSEELDGANHHALVSRKAERDSN
jgi:hypothetical protein